MKKIVAFIIVLFPLVLAAITVIPAGPVSGTWTLDKSPYFVTGEIYVESTAMLEIEAGVEVMFTGWHKFIVYGSLMALGEPELWIRFTVANQHFRWHGIRFMETTVPSVLDHCIIEFGHTIMDPTPNLDNCGGGILCYNTNDQLSIKNSIIRYNQAWFGGGIHIRNSSPVIDNCKIIDNIAEIGGGIDVLEAGNPQIINSRIASNEGSHGGGIAMNDCYPLLKFNTIINNSSSYVGGGLYMHTVADFMLERNIIAFNSSQNGGGIYLNNSNGLFKHNTISYNEAVKTGGALYLVKASPAFNSDLLYYNQASLLGHQACLATEDSDPTFEYCNVQGGKEAFSGTGSGANYSGLYAHCIEGNPRFTNVMEEDFTITWHNYPYPDYSRSACIDAGCPGLIPEPDGTCCDIGAFCYFQKLDVPENLASWVGSQSYFVAGWEQAFGSLGYLLDVARDETFIDLIYNGHKIIEDTLFPVILPEPMDICYFRVRSYNTALISANSSIHIVFLNPASEDEHLSENIKIYSSRNGIHVNISQNIDVTGDLWVYDMRGQLLVQERIFPGLNNINYDGPDQVLIVKVLMNKTTYQQKIFLH
ncbi:MAG: right-handed parallel beta-helix repeat-containing protein [Bacteroidota bacterium]